MHVKKFFEHVLHFFRTYTIFNSEKVHKESKALSLLSENDIVE